MSLVTYMELCAFVDEGLVVGVEAEQINGASIDVRLGRHVQIERPAPLGHSHLIDFRARDEMQMDNIDLLEFDGIVLRPGQTMLASTIETFNLPLNVAAEFKLKSSTARRFLQHMLAGWCDPGWHGSALTMELKNVSQHHSILLRYGDAIGQMVFFHGKTVPLERSYKVRGRYNGDTSTQGVKK